MSDFNDPDNCLGRLFLANIIPAPVPSLQLAVRWGEFDSALCKLPDRIEVLETEVSALEKGVG